MILIGYSGHAFGVCGILKNAGQAITGYCDTTEKSYNPFQLTYFGTEHDAKALAAIAENGCFIAIGDNVIRNNIYDQLALKSTRIFNAIHPYAVIDASVNIAAQAVMIAAGVIVNPLTNIGTGVILNTRCIVEHECVVGNFSHIGPGAVLCGNVKIGERSFVGAGAVVRQGITIGKNAMIGAGAVVVKDVADNAVIIGNPGRAK